MMHKAEEDRAAAGQKKRAAQLVKQHLLLLLALAAYLLIGCPIQHMFGVPCPGCGLSRAHLAALQLDFAAAFSYHPLFFTMIPSALYFAHRKAWRLPGSDRFAKILACLLITAFLAVYVLRLFVFDDPVIRIDWQSSILYKIIHHLGEFLW